MFAVVQNGNIVQLIQPDVAFTIGEKQYSARFIRNATEAERKSVGVYEVIQGTQQDQRFYWVTGPSYRVNETNQTVEATYTATPKALEDKLETKEDGTPLLDLKGNQVVTKGLKSQFIAQVKAQAGSLLNATDWKVVRAAEGGKALDDATKAERVAIRTKSDDFETQIKACTTVEQLAALQFNWE